MIKQVAVIWATAMVISSITIAFLSFFTLDDVVEGVLIYIAQCLLFAASVAGIPLILDMRDIKHQDNEKDNHYNN